MLRKKLIPTTNSYLKGKINMQSTMYFHSFRYPVLSLYEESERTPKSVFHFQN